MARSETVSFVRDGWTGRGMLHLRSADPFAHRDHTHSQTDPLSRIIQFSIRAHRRRLVMISFAYSVSATVRNFVARMATAGESDKTKVAKLILIRSNPIAAVGMFVLKLKYGDIEDILATRANEYSILPLKNGSC